MSERKQRNAKESKCERHYTGHRDGHGDGCVVNPKSADLQFQRNFYLLLSDRTGNFNPEKIKNAPVNAAYICE